MAEIAGKAKEDERSRALTVSAKHVESTLPGRKRSSTVDNDPDDHAGEVQEHDHLFFTAEHPGVSFCGACFAHLLVLAALVACANYFGSSFFPFSTDVPLYLRNEQQRQYWDAVAAAKISADVAPAVPAHELERSMTLAKDIDINTG